MKPRCYSLRLAVGVGAAGSRRRQWWWPWPGPPPRPRSQSTFTVDRLFPVTRRATPLVRRHIAIPDLSGCRASTRHRRSLSHRPGGRQWRGCTAMSAPRRPRLRGWTHSNQVVGEPSQRLSSPPTCRNPQNRLLDACGTSGPRPGSGEALGGSLENRLPSCSLLWLGSGARPRRGPSARSGSRGVCRARSSAALLAPMTVEWQEGMWPEHRTG
jgi:hypothetical protein